MSGCGRYCCKRPKVPRCRLLKLGVVHAVPRIHHPVGGAAASVPFAARAQQAPMPVIGFLSTRSARDLARLIAAFGKGLEEAGFPKATTFLSTTGSRMAGWIGCRNWRL